jgi:hypothetical protein
MADAALKLINIQASCTRQLLLTRGKPAGPQREFLADIIESNQLLNLPPKSDLLVRTKQGHPADVSHVGAQQIAAVAAI